MTSWFACLALPHTHTQTQPRTHTHMDAHTSRQDVNRGCSPLTQAAPVSWCSRTAKSQTCSSLTHTPSLVGVCVCVHLGSRSPSFFFFFPHHPLTSPPAAPSLTPLFLSRCIPAVVPASIRSPCTCDWKPVFLCLPANYSPQAATPSHRKGRDKLQEYTCAWYECQNPDSLTANSWPNNWISEPQLQTKNPPDSFISRSQFFKARYEPHYQMRKAIRDKCWHFRDSAFQRLSSRISFTDVTGGWKNKTRSFSSSAKHCSEFSDTNEYKMCFISGCTELSRTS